MHFTLLQFLYADTLLLYALLHVCWLYQLCIVTKVYFDVCSAFTCRYRLGYLYDLVNYLDLASIFTPLLIIPFRMTNLDVQWMFAALAYLFVGLKMFKYFTAFRYTSTFIV